MVGGLSCTIVNSPVLCIAYSTRLYRLLELFAQYVLMAAGLLFDIPWYCNPFIMLAR